MLRYVGYVLVVLMVLALAAGFGLLIFAALGERLTDPATLRLVAFDAVSPAGGVPGRIRACLESVDFGRPVPDARLTVRYADEWQEAMMTGSGGQAVGGRRPGLGAGRHEFTVSFPDMYPRLDVVARGTLWVLPADVRVVWVDAQAVVSASAAADGLQPEPSGPALDALKMLAAGRQVVYLVAAKPADYAMLRRRLALASAPAGPAFFIAPGDEPSRLKALKDVWPNCEAAVVSSAGLAGAAGRLKVPLYRVPAVGGQETAEAAAVWRQVLEQLSARRGAGRRAGDSR